MKKGLIGTVVVLAVLVVGALWVASIYTNARNEGNKRELALTAEYKALMADYGQFRASAIDQMGIAKEKSEAMHTILTDAVAGRYNKPGSPQVDNGKLMSAITEAYPDLNGLAIFDKIVEFVAQGRAKFAQRQEKIAESVKDFNTWRTTGSLLHPTIVAMIGYPSDLLEINVAGKTITGKAALEKMSTPIISAEAGKIFDEGVDQQLPTGK